MVETQIQRLPPLRKKVRRSILFLNALYVLIGCFLMISVYFATSISPQILHQNYDSISAANDMKVAVVALKFCQGHSEKDTQRALESFEKAFAFEKSNISVFGEGEIVRSLDTIWQQVVKSRSISVGQEEQLTRILNQLLQMNEAMMFDLAKENERFGRTALLVSILLFSILLVFSVFFIDALANAIVWPIKEIAERLKNNPVLSEALQLPPPESIEMQILTEEMTELWSRLSEFARMNVGELNTQSKKLEAVLETVEDAIMVLDAKDTIIHCNRGMLKILHLKDTKVHGLALADLPTGSFNFMRLRNFLRSHPKDQAEIEFVFGSNKRLFAFRRKEIIEKNHQLVGVIYLFHDITGGWFQESE